MRIELATPFSPWLVARGGYNKTSLEVFKKRVGVALQDMV